MIVKVTQDRWKERRLLSYIIMIPISLLFCSVTTCERDIS